jgi:hypothetical protein
MTVLREQLLGGRSVVLAGRVRAPLRQMLTSLGATVHELVRPEPAEDRVGEWTRARAPIHAVVYDAAGGRIGLDEAWVAVREVAVGSLLSAGGKVVLLGPRENEYEFAAAVRAGLENLARTLSVEWARFQVTAAMLAPGAESSDGDLAEIVSFLLSHAGDYFSGCRLDVCSMR